MLIADGEVRLPVAGMLALLSGRDDRCDAGDPWRRRMRCAVKGETLFFELSSWVLALIIFVALLGATAGGLAIGHSMRAHAHKLSEPFAVLQGALLGLVGLILAFGLSLAVGRYEDRRAAVVNEANAIGTTYLRAQTLREPVRSDSMTRLRRYTDTTIRLSDSVPGSASARRAAADGLRIQRELWGFAGRALSQDPQASAPRLYAQSLNEMIDLQAVRIAGLQNRVPSAVLVLEVLGAIVALSLLAAYLAFMGRGAIGVLLAAGLVALLLLVTFDLDRPTRGLITVPDKPLVELRAEMALPPAASGP